MTLKEKKVQIALGTYLPYMWNERKKLTDKGDKLIAGGYKLRDEGSNLTAEGDKLIAEGEKLIIEGDLLYINTVKEVCGKKAIINWDTGEVKHD